MFGDVLNFIKMSNHELVGRYKPIKFARKVVCSAQINFTTKDYQNEFLDTVEKKKNIFCIYQDVKKKSDTLLFESSNMKCNIMAVFPEDIGREYSKTTSFKIVQKGVQKNCLFEVLEGEGYFILESYDMHDIKKVIIIKVKKKSIIYVPQYYSFTIINTSERRNLVCLALLGKNGNFVGKTLETNYGNTLFLTKNGFVKNSNVSSNYLLKEYEGDYLEDMRFDKKIGLYKEFVELPEKFSFLK